MRIIEKKIESKDKLLPIIIIPIGNVDIGVPNFDKKAFKKTLEQIKNNPNAHAMFLNEKEEKKCQEILLKNQ